MAYTKTEWKDQVVENPRTYSMRDNGDDTVTLLDAFGTVTELGTPVNAANMNHIEDGIAAVEALANTKQAPITGGATTITSSNLTANRALVSNSSGKVGVSAVTSTELGYLDGVTSAIQTQLNGKLTANISKQAKGYCQFSNGLIINWGTATGSGTINFAKEYTTTNAVVMFQRSSADGTNDNDAVNNITKSSFYLTNYGGGGGRWLAVGY